VTSHSRTVFSSGCDTCGQLVVGHVQLDLVDANLLPVEDAGCQGSSSRRGLEHLQKGGFEEEEEEGQ